MTDIPVTSEVPSETTRLLTVALSGGALRIIENDEVLMSAETASDLTEKANALGPDNPLAMEKDMSLSLLVPHEARGAVLEALLPSPVLSDWLLEQGIEDVVPISDPLFDAGNVVDDHPWGWYRIYSEDRWIFAPLGEGQDVAAASAWMSASMAGAVIETGCRCWGTTILTWRTDDTGSSEFSVQCEVQDWDALLAATYGSMLEDTFCPECEDEDPSGWEINVTASAIFTDAVVGAALTNIWRPCDSHQLERIELEAAHRLWEWSGDRWVRQ